MRTQTHHEVLSTLMVHTNKIIISVLAWSRTTTWPRSLCRQSDTEHSSHRTVFSSAVMTQLGLAIAIRVHFWFKTSQQRTFFEEFDTRNIDQYCSWAWEFTKKRHSSMLALQKFCEWKEKEEKEKLPSMHSSDYWSTIQPDWCMTLWVKWLKIRPPGLVKAGYPTKPPRNRVRNPTYSTIKMSSIGVSDILPSGSDFLPKAWLWSYILACSSKGV